MAAPGIQTTWAVQPYEFPRETIMQFQNQLEWITYQLRS